MKPLPATLRLCILLALAAASALLLWSRGPGSQTRQIPVAPLETEVAASQTDAVLKANAYSARNSEANACCDKPPGRAALMQGAHSTVPHTP